MAGLRGAGDEMTNEVIPEGAIPVKFHMADGPMGENTRIVFDESLAMKPGDRLHYTYDDVTGFVTGVYIVRADERITP